MNIYQSLISYNLIYPKLPTKEMIDFWLKTINLNDLYFYLQFFVLKLHIFDENFPPEMRYNHFFYKWLHIFPNNYSLIKKQWISLYFTLLSYNNIYPKNTYFLINKYNELIKKDINNNDIQLINAIYNIELILLTFQSDNNFKWHLINKLNTYPDEIKSYASTEEITFY